MHQVAIAWLQTVTVASTSSESAQAQADAKKKRDVAIAVPTVIGGVAIIGMANPSLYRHVYLPGA